MVTNRWFQKILTARRALVIWLIVILGIAVSTGFIWMQTDQIIAPPSLRLLGWL
jgi:hypothetical protein